MAQKGIREFYAKKLFSEGMPKLLKRDEEYYRRFKETLLLVGPDTDLKKLPMMLENKRFYDFDKFVAKPDQLFGKRGKNKLVKTNVNAIDVTKFIEENRGKEITINGVTDKLQYFLVEPFIPHEIEYFTAIMSDREGDALFFSPDGGVSVEENWDEVSLMHVDILDYPKSAEIEKKILEGIPKDRRHIVADFIEALFKFYREYQFTYIELNPFTIVGGHILPLDLVAKLDDAASFECSELWGEIEFPSSFGMKLSREEAFVEDLDRRSGASLKLTVLNPAGRVWLLVAGGGASIIYADTVCDLGFGNELANYGEYSGNPSIDETYQYTKTVLDLMTRNRDPKGRSKILIIGGGIANFTDVAVTFKGIKKAIREYKERLKVVNARIFVRRGGPNYKEGLRTMKELGVEIGVPIEVYGPELHMTKIVSKALEAK